MADGTVWIIVMALPFASMIVTAYMIMKATRSEEPELPKPPKPVRTNEINAARKKMKQNMKDLEDG